MQILLQIGRFGLIQFFKINVLTLPEHIKAAVIFALKNFGWSDKQEHVHDFGEETTEKISAEVAIKQLRMLEEVGLSGLDYRSIEGSSEVSKMR